MTDKTIVDHRKFLIISKKKMTPGIALWLGIRETELIYIWLL